MRKRFLTFLYSIPLRRYSLYAYRVLILLKAFRICLTHSYMNYTIDSNAPPIRMSIANSTADLLRNALSLYERGTEIVSKHNAAVHKQRGIKT